MDIVPFTTSAKPWNVCGSDHYDALIQSLLLSKSNRERKRNYSQLTGGFIPDELRDALCRARRSGLRRIFDKLILGHSWKSHQLISRLLGELDDWTDRNIWSVSTPFDNGVLFSCGSDSLVVGFTGRSNVLMVSTHKILQAISHEYDLLLLRDPLDDFYQRGIPGLGVTPLETASAVSVWAEKNGYCDIRVMGTSAGYFMGFFAALWQGWGHAMLVGGPVLSVVPIFERAFSEIVDFDASVHHCYPSEHAMNAEGAAEIKRRAPQSAMFPYPGITAHNLLESIDAKSDVVAYIREHLVDPPSKQT